MTAAILVTGGAGYIGSHTTRHLLRAGFRVTVLDNLYSGHRWAVDPAAEFVEGDIADETLLASVMREAGVDAVIHFAGHIVVPESVLDPLKYYRNNCIGSQRLIEACRRCGVAKFIFSSSAAVYGQPEQVPVAETSPTAPVSPYGRSKLITEWMLRDVTESADASDPFSYVALRYFNVAGAAPDHSLGQATPAATHLIKVACEAACGQRDGLEIFGSDYSTRDGTCVRDYIHVEDLAVAHVLALQYLTQGGASAALNCGYGRGFSVREVVNTVRSVSGVDFTVTDARRRPGDPPELIADSSRLCELLDWSPRYDDLETICRTAWEWELELARRTECIA